MQLLHVFVRLVSLPLDLVFLAGDTLKVTAWLLRRFFYRRLRIPTPPPPFCEPLQELPMGDQTIRLCPGGRKYANSFVFRLLCPSAKGTRVPEKGAVCSCLTQHYMKLCAGRYLCALAFTAALCALLLAALWWTVGRPLAAQMRSRMRLTSEPAATTPGPGGPARQTAPVDTQQAVPASPLELARAAKTAGDIEAVLTHAGKAVELDPEQAEPYALLGWAESARGEPEQAVEVYNKALELDTSLVEAHVGLAKVLRETGSHEDALRHVDAALRIDPENLGALEQRGELHIARRQWQKAAAIYKQLSAAQPEVVELKTRLAELLLRSGKVNDAYGAAAEVLARSPEDVAAHLIVAEIFLRQGLASLAAGHCSRALAQDMRIVKAHKLLAEALMAEGSFGKAVRELEFLKESLPDDLEVSVNLALCYEKTGHTSKAVACLQAARKAHPDSAQPDVNLGQIHLGRKDIRDAIASYRAALERDPGHVIALNNLAAALLDQDGSKEAVKEALALAARAWSLRPDHPVIADTLGWAYYHAKQHKDALAVLSYATRKLPKRPTVRYHLAAALHANGELEPAQKQLEAALALASETPFEETDQARQLLDDIRRRLARQSE